MIFESGRTRDKFVSRASENIFDRHHRLKFTAVFRFNSVGPFTFMGPFRFRVALLHLHRAFYYTICRLSPRESPSRGLGSGLRRLWWLTSTATLKSGKCPCASFLPFPLISIILVTRAYCYWGTSSPRAPVLRVATPLLWSASYVL